MSLYPNFKFLHKRFYLEFEDELSFFIFYENLTNWLQSRLLGQWLHCLLLLSSTAECSPTLHVHVHHSQYTVLILFCCSLFLSLSLHPCSRKSRMLGTARGVVNQGGGHTAAVSTGSSTCVHPSPAIKGVYAVWKPFIE